VVKGKERGEKRAAAGCREVREVGSHTCMSV